MSLAIPALAAARAGLQGALARIDRAASIISRAGLESSATPAPTPSETSTTDVPAPAGNAPELDVTGAMVDLLMAQRAFAAQLRVIQAVDQTMQDTLDSLGGG